MLFNKINFPRAFAYRIRPHYAKEYRRFQEEIAKWDSLSPEEQRNQIFLNCKNIVDFAFNNTVFYKDFYQKNHFSPDVLKSFDDLQRIPVINKKILLERDIENRSSNIKPRYFMNTGGSTGVSLSFYVDRNLTSKELSHMHYMWKDRLGYNISANRLRFTGRSNIKNGIDYNYFQNITSWDIYSEFETVAESFKRKRKHFPVIRFLHGYPSAIYEFALYCEKDQELCRILKEHLMGILFCSEFPYDLWRRKIENVFNVKTLSWYGHTEACILAYEKKEEYVYSPFQTYGFTEAIQQPDGDYHLIGTDYCNYASPLIRYDTEDTVDVPQEHSGVLTEFQIKNGRAGQYIPDRNGKKIALTGLIFGRHHQLFDYCSNIQISSLGNGKAEVLYVLKNPNNKLDNPAALFNSENVDIVFLFREISAPIKTKSGKVLLLVKKI